METFFPAYLIFDTYLRVVTKIYLCQTETFQIFTPYYYCRMRRVLKIFIVFFFYYYSQKLHSNLFSVENYTFQPILDVCPSVSSFVLSLIFLQ